MMNCTVTNDKVGPDDKSGPRDLWGGRGANYGGTVALVNCTTSSNTAKGNFIGISGGVRYNYYGSAYMNHSTFVGNVADGGGGLQVNGHAERVGCTFSPNRTYWGGGMFLWKSLGIWNTIVADNRAGINGADVDGHVHSGGNHSPTRGYNLIGKTDGSSGWDSTAAGGTDLTNVASGLTGLGNNGGPTQTVALSSSNPAIHNGNTCTTRTRPRRCSPTSAAFRIDAFS